MNELAKQYWETYWGEKPRPASVTSWQFGAQPDDLAQLVMDRIKTATCSGYIFYEMENEPLPRVNDYSIILSSKDEPLAIIKTVDVSIMPMNEVPEDFAIAEGEGDRTYRYWKEAHETFFKKELEQVGRTFSDDILVVCERFELIDKKVKSVYSTGS
ncbi:ASCH domain-containing protein [Jeotgalibacillus marinus]|uniref:ASCH domain-containing protein n=1 Tax=Jeotgalibacillus marinus TaxID=86667 RepID=A0ABV3Q6H2_9BACL